MPRLLDLPSRDLSMQLFFFVSIQPIKLRSSMQFTKPSPNKQYRLIASLQKIYLQINTFLASNSRTERNLKALLMKTTESLSGKARGRILSSINKNLDGSQSVVVRDWFT